MSGLCSATALGVNSPRITCSTVISRKATAVAMPWLAATDHRPGRKATAGCNSAGQARLADPAQRQTGQRNAELRGGDRIVQVVDRVEHGHGARCAAL